MTAIGYRIDLFLHQQGIDTTTPGASGHGESATVHKWRAGNAVGGLV
jgi:hypothetical protein